MTGGPSVLLEGPLYAFLPLIPSFLYHPSTFFPHSLLARIWRYNPREIFRNVLRWVLVHCETEFRTFITRFAAHYFFNLTSLPFLLPPFPCPGNLLWHHKCALVSWMHFRNQKISVCPVTQENILKFKNDLQILDWSIINDLPDVNNMYTSFIYMVQNLYDKSFPIKMWENCVGHPIHKSWNLSAWYWRV